MAHVAERFETFASAFEALRHDPAFGPEWLGKARESAFRRFVDRGFPSTREEDWRFTNVAPIADTAFGRAPVSSPAREAIAPYIFEGLPAIVVVNGRVSKALSSLDALPAGVTLSQLRECGVDIRPAGASPSSRPPAPAEAAGPRLHVSSPEPQTANAFVDLNAAFFEDGLVLEIAPKTVVTVPVQVLFVSSPGATPAMISPRLVVMAGEQSQSSIIESYAGVGGGVTFTNAVTDIRVGPGAVVDHVKVQRELPTAFHVANMAVRLDRASTFASRSLTFGGRLTRNDIVALLGGEGAECTLNGLYVAGGDTLVDNHTTIDHAQPHCPSHEVYKGILKDRAKAVFNGKIVVRLDAQKTDAKQTNKALLLSDEAQINTKPQLEIFADDVKCTHGAAIGQLDEDAMFYLRARGIGETDARKLLIHAFAEDILNGIKADGVRDTMLHVLDQALGTA